MALTEPLDLYDLLVVKLAGDAASQGTQLSIFLFLSLVVISLMAARFRLTAMSAFMAVTLYAVIISQAVNNAGAFGIIAAIGIIGFCWMAVVVIKDRMQ